MNPRRRTTASLVSVAVLVAALAASARPALAAFPGANGKIVFTSDRDGNDEIYVMNADGTAQTNLTNNPATDARPVWSPDGSRIAFASTRGGFFFDIWVMNSDGSGAPVDLTNTPAGSDVRPDWSPDGTKLTFYFGDVGHDVYVMNADGSGRTNLTNSAASDFGPVWSPDGTK